MLAMANRQERKITEEEKLLASQMWYAHSLKMKPVESSNIKALAYSRKYKLLVVQFRNGRKYLYTKVERSCRDQLFKAESKGQYFNHVVKNFYDTYRMETGDEG